MLSFAFDIEAVRIYRDPVLGVSNNKGNKHTHLFRYEIATVVQDRCLTWQALLCVETIIANGPHRGIVYK